MTTTDNHSIKTGTISVDKRRAAYLYGPIQIRRVSFIVLVKRKD